MEQKLDSHRIQAVPKGMLKYIPNIKVKHGKYTVEDIIRECKYKLENKIETHSNPVYLVTHKKKKLIVKEIEIFDKKEFVSDTLISDGFREVLFSYYFYDQGLSPKVHKSIYVPETNKIYLVITRWDTDIYEYVQNHKTKDTREIQKKVIGIVKKMVFGHNIMCMDNHLGNFVINRQTKKVAVIDFGHFCSMTKESSKKKVFEESKKAIKKQFDELRGRG